MKHTYDKAQYQARKAAIERVKADQDKARPKDIAQALGMVSAAR